MYEHDYIVDVYEDDRVTYAGSRIYQFMDQAVHFATLNQPCIVYLKVFTKDGESSYKEIASYGMEDEE